MGFNTVIFIQNDSVHEIERDPKSWWDKVWEAVNGRREIYINGTEVVTCHHASSTAIISAGGNHAKVLDWVHSTPHTFTGGRDEESDRTYKLKVLREMADHLGYSVRRKNKGPREF